MRTKAVLDTNVLVSGIFWKGPPSEILKAWHEGRFILAASLPILHEYRRVIDELTRKRASRITGAILELIEVHSELVEPVSFSKTLCDDPDDDKFLEAAIAARADYVVSGDAALLRVKHHEGVSTSNLPNSCRLCSVEANSQNLPTVAHLGLQAAPGS